MFFSILLLVIWYYTCDLLFSYWETFILFKPSWSILDKQTENRRKIMSLSNGFVRRRRYVAMAIVRYKKATSLFLPWSNVCLPIFF